MLLGKKIFLNEGVKEKYP